MPSNDAQSAVNFQSDSQTVDFQPDRNFGAEEGAGRFAEAAQNVSWSKVGIGVGAAAAVAGAAYAATRFIGRGSEGGGRSDQSGIRNER